MLERTLAALLASDYPAARFEIVVVDDGGDPATRRVVQAVQDESVTVTLLSGRGRGAAAARNDGAAAADGDYLVFVDDDILVPPNHLAAQLEVREAHGECISGADWWEFTPEVEAELRATPVGRYRLALEERYRHPPAERWTFPAGLATAYFVLRPTLFNELGRFDERFPRAGVEDWEFCLRAKDRGCKLILDSELRLLHDDKRLTLPQLCTREEWRAFSIGILAHLRPAEYRDEAVVRANSPVRPDDSLRLRLQKGVKRALATPVILRALHSATAVAEHLLRPERVLYRLYTAVISVHYLRGFRAGFSSGLVGDRLREVQDA